MEKEKVLWSHTESSLTLTWRAKVTDNWERGWKFKPRIVVFWPRCHPFSPGCDWLCCWTNGHSLYTGYSVQKVPQQIRLGLTCFITARVLLSVRRVYWTLAVRPFVCMEKDILPSAEEWDRQNWLTWQISLLPAVTHSVQVKVPADPFKDSLERDILD